MTVHSNPKMELYLSMPMWKIKQHRDVTAKLLRALRGMSNRRAVATLNLATVMCDEREKYWEPTPE